MKIPALALLVLLCAAQEEETPKPLAVFHGFGDACIYPGMASFTRKLGKMVGTYSKCIEIGTFGSIASVTMDFEKQGQEACQKIAENPEFDNGFSVVGLSQGGLIARYVVESCPGSVPVRNMATFGAPHRGVGKIPQCWNGVFCDSINWVARQFVYFDIVQRLIGPAGYFRDPAHLRRYRKHSHFLAALDNEVESNSMAEHKERVESLNAVFLGWFENDHMVYPPETGKFSELQKDGTILPMEETDLYDTLGLRKLNEEGRITVHAFPGDHLQFSMEEVEELVVPILQS